MQSCFAQISFSFLGALDLNWNYQAFCSSLQIAIEETGQVCRRLAINCFINHARGLLTYHPSFLRSGLAGASYGLSVIILMTLFCNVSRVQREMTPHVPQTEQQNLK